VVVDSTPWIEPLVDVAREALVAVALVDRNEMRVFHGTTAELEELPAEDSIHLREHRSATGDEAQAHYRDVAEQLLSLLKTRGFDVLVLGARQEERGEIAGALHPYVRDRLIGEVDLDRASATVDDVRRAAETVCERRHQERVGDALERLKERLGRGERAAGGVQDVLAALNERRVETLLYERGREIPGVVCPADGWLGVDAGTCPVDGTTVEQRETILESAAEAAVLQDAEVLRLDGFDHPDLGPHGGIAAILRF
jgi:peptide subunit release factor 1 (eRF1)